MIECFWMVLIWIVHGDQWCTWIMNLWTRVTCLFFTYCILTLLKNHFHKVHYRCYTNVDVSVHNKHCKHSMIKRVCTSFLAVIPRISRFENWLDSLPLFAIVKPYIRIVISKIENNCTRTLDCSLPLSCTSYSINKVKYDLFIHLSIYVLHRSSRWRS